MERLVSRASLQAPISSHILTAEAMNAWPWARSNIKNVTFLFVTSDQIIAHANDLEEPYEGVKTIVGTRSHHICAFTGSKEWNFAHVQTSDITSEMYTNVHLKESKTVCLDEVCPGKYLACIGTRGGMWV